MGTFQRMANLVDKLGWKLIGGVTATAAANLTRKTAAQAFKKRTGEAPPDELSSPVVPVGTAVVWALLSGVAVGLARLLVERAAAAAWFRVRGELPPGFAPKKSKSGDAAVPAGQSSEEASAATGDN